MGSKLAPQARGCLPWGRRVRALRVVIVPRQKQQQRQHERETCYDTTLLNTFPSVQEFFKPISEFYRIHKRYLTYFSIVFTIVIKQAPTQVLGV